MILLYTLSRSLTPNTLAASTNASSPFDPVTGKCININGCRTMTSILWSCLSVILTCTWVAIHPNIPRVGRHSAVVLFRNIVLMVVAILAPKIIVLWAMWQWYSAKAIAKQYKKYGWGMSHAFFTIMGGFALYDRDRFCGYLWNDEARIYSEDGEKWHSSEEEAKEYIEQIKMYIQRTQDHCSQGNTLMSNAGGTDQPEERTNLLAQERGIPEPPCLLEYFLQKGYITITEGEIKDKSHADFIAKSIALIQTTWFIIQVVARGMKHLAITELEIVTVGFALLNFCTYYLWWHKPLRVQYPVRVIWRQQRDSPTSQSKRSWMETIREGVAVICSYKDSSEYSHILLPFAIIMLPPWLILSVVGTCHALVEDCSWYTNEFSTRLKKDPPQLYIAVYSIAAAFGAIHCIPWAFQFPTDAEQLLWQICAVAAAAAPIAMGCLHWAEKELSNPDSFLGAPIIVLAVFFGPVCYVISRMFLIILAFLTLRDLPPSAYQTVPWTTFIPHIG